MNAQTNITPADEMPADSLPMPRATLETIERQRNRALEAMERARAAFAEGMEAAHEAAVSFSREYKDPAALSDKAKEALFAGNAERKHYRPHEDSRTWAQVFADETRLAVDRAVWAHIIEATDLERLMDRQAREEFEQSLNSDPPAPTVENVIATLGHFLGEAPQVFKRGIANAFSKLDRRFRSHDGFKIGARVILDRYFDSHGFAYYREAEQTLYDIERVFVELDGKRHGASYAGICGLIRRDAGYGSERPIVIESDWVRVRIFKNGNAHLWLTRPDLVKKVNRLLADYYGEVIGEGADVCDVSDLGPSYHLTPARNFGFFETSDETARQLFERVSLPYLIRENECARVLEPSAGNGALADKVREMGAAVQCVEMDIGRAAVLRRKGHAVTERDFLQLKPSDFSGLFDGVVMNPPFDRGRDCDHVRHALQFLRPGGFLLAIMSAGTEYRDDERTNAFRAVLAKTCRPASSWGDRWFKDLPEGSFAHAGTNVNTLTLALYKKEA